MKFTIIIFALLALSLPEVLHAQPYDYRELNDSTNLGHAMNICQRHHHTFTTTSGRSVGEGNIWKEYDWGWEICYKLSEECNQFARDCYIQEQSEGESQAERDLAFIKNVVEQFETPQH